MTMTLFRNAAIVDGELPEPRGGCDVLIEGERIREVSDRPIASAGATAIDLKGRTLMPGLIDAHFHAFAIYLNMWRAEEVPLTLMTAMALERLKGALDRGFTTVRDTAGGDWGIKQAVARGIVTGPRMFISGKGISQTGGHGDMRLRTDDAAPCPCHNAHQFICRIADGNAEVRRAVRDELRKGADQIKIMASGGVASPTDPVGAWGYSEDEIKAIVHEARARGTYVLAHAYTAEAITRAVRCGVRTIEHGNLVDEAAARVMAEQGAFAVPTLVTYDALANEGEALGLPADSVAKIEEVRHAGLRSLEIFRAAGVPMGFGTDLLGESQRLQSNEFRLRSEVLSPLEILRSATVVGAQVLGQVGQLGQITAGAHADMLVVDGNPLASLDCLLGQGERIPVVMKGGKIHAFDLQA
jgi:imidazolonepropionase-like amidohydrolase